jgi:hypothetical protein
MRAVISTKEIVPIASKPRCIHVEDKEINTLFTILTKVRVDVPSTTTSARLSFSRAVLIITNTILIEVSTALEIYKACLSKSLRPVTSSLVKELGPAMDPSVPPGFPFGIPEEQTSARRSNYSEPCASNQETADSTTRKRHRPGHEGAAKFKRPKSLRLETDALPKCLVSDYPDIPPEN